MRQETLHYDPQARALHARRSKEEADDYRYFPEPDLVPLEPSSDTVRAAALGRCPSCPPPDRPLPEPTTACPPQDAADLNAAPAIADYFEAVAAASGDAKAAADWVRNQPARGRGDPRRRASQGSSG